MCHTATTEWQLAFCQMKSVHVSAEVLTHHYYRELPLSRDPGGQNKVLLKTQGTNARDDEVNYTITQPAI